ncbi:hypothetical protein BH23CHL2_BH23CHL2_24030 [soil metagenome]
MRDIGDTHSLAITLNNLGEALRTLDRYDEATSRFEESLAIFRELEATHGVAYLLANLGDIARARGRPEPTLDRYLEALGLFQQLGYREGLLSVVGALAALDAFHGNPERAVELFAAEDALREATGFALVPNVRADYDRAQGVARERLSEQAFEAAWQRGHRMTLATAASLAGSVELVACATSGSSPLSPREMDVAQLVAREMTNQQIAEVLDLSVRTAETHVRNILRKLGLSSRREIAGWAERHKLPSG